ncbi:hypothetical protein QOZ80_1BG0068880 [Eleusine coracana subsp. coracana]|nr:hypothetical protein QOZ80_1BG0068880 [Eleusine coracana subsp. coracana]
MGHFVSQLDLSGLPPPSLCNWGKRQIEVTVETDHDGDFHVVAVDLGSTASAKTSVYHNGRLPQEMIDRLIREAKEERVKEREKLRTHLSTITNQMVEGDEMMVHEKKQMIEEAVRTAGEWLERNPEAGEFEYTKRLWELKELQQSSSQDSHEEL